MLKPLTLTEEQRIKLLEMAKTLFPEYTEIETSSSFPYYNCNSQEGIRLNMPKLQLAWFKNPTQDAISLIYEDKEDERSQTIHWFEFCMTHLLNKIWDLFEKYPENHIYNGLAKNKENSLKSDLLRHTIKQHPVDYLYEQFKLI